MTVLIAGFIILLAVMFAIGGWKSFKLWRRIVGTPTSRTDRIKPGLVVVEGKIAAQGETLTSPYTEKECVYYKFLVEKRNKNRSRKSSVDSNWLTVVKDKKFVTCLVEDSYGSIEVDLEYAEIKLKKDLSAHSGFLQSAPAKLEQLLQERYDVSSKGPIFNFNLRYTETSLEIGEPVYVIGFAREIDGRIIITNEEGYGRDEVTAGRKNAAPKLWRAMPSLTVSDLGKQNISMRHLGSAALLTFASLAFFALSVVVLFAEKLQHH